MAKKQTKPASSGVDISNLSKEQVDLLLTEVKNKSLEFENANKKAKLEKLQESGELASLRKEFNDLKQDFKKLNTETTFHLLVPISFTVKTNSQHDTLFGTLDDNGFNDPFNLVVDDYDMFSRVFVAGVTKPKDIKSKDVSNLTKPQRWALDNLIVAAIDNASSEELIDIIPKEILDKYDEFIKSLNKFFKKAEKAGLDFNDVDVK